MSALFYSDFFFLHQVIKAAVVRVLTTGAAVMKTLMEIMMHFLAPVLLLQEGNQLLLQKEKDKW